MAQIKPTREIASRHTLVKGRAMWLVSDSGAVTFIAIVALMVAVATMALIVS